MDADTAAKSPDESSVDQISRGLLTARDMPRWYLLAVLLSSVLILSIAGVGYTTYVDNKRAASEREADRRWCELLVQLDSAYSIAPPSTETGRRVAKSIHDLKVSLDC